jgi:hypothetical protein
MLSRPTDLDGFRRLRALKISESVIGGTEMDPDEDDEGQEKTPGDGLLNDD